MLRRRLERSAAVASLLWVGCGSPSIATAPSATTPSTTTPSTTIPEQAAAPIGPLHVEPPPPSTLALTDALSCVIEGAQVICWGQGHGPRVEESFVASTTIAARGPAICALDTAGTTLRCDRGADLFSGPMVETVAQGVALEPGDDGVVRTADGHFVRPGSSPPDVPPGTVSVRSASGTTCALSETGTLSCTTRDEAAFVIEGVLDFAFENAALCVLHPEEVACAPTPTWRAQGAPTRFGGAAGARRLVAGAAHVCVLAQDGRVRCAGTNERGELGRGGHDAGTNELVAVGDVHGATEIAAGAHHTCARTPDGTRCWGDDGGAQVSGTRVTFAATAMTGATMLVSGWDHTCALGGDGALWCWGSGDAGQLGAASAGDRLLPTRAQLPGLGVITEIAAGPESTCVLSAGSVWCFGGSTRGRQESPDLGAISDAVHIGGGGRSVQVVRAGGEITSYGAASGARLEAGRREAGPGRLPVEVARVVGDGAFVCALGVDGRVWGWGSDFGGEVGDGGDGVRDTPTPVIAPIPMPASPEAREHLYESCDSACGVMTDVRLLTSRGRSTCAVLTSGRIACWGEDGHDVFAEDVRFARRPVLLDDVEHAESACLGARFLCVLHEDGTVRCRGNALAGAERNAELATLDHVTQIACGGTHACALREDGSVQCWGESRSGRLGSDAVIRGRAVTVARP